MSYFYPRPPGGGRPDAPPTGRKAKKISIHALRVEGDIPDGADLNDDAYNFYPRPPGGGRPSCRTARRYLSQKFLSTPSGWRATSRYAALSPTEQDFYPRPPGGGRPFTKMLLSPRSPWISIHALRVEGDLPPSDAISPIYDFYPRPPGGGRRLRRFIRLTPVEFLSTPSGWRATSRSPMHSLRRRISIHALRVEGDTRWHRPQVRVAQFLSTPSGWRATLKVIQVLPVPTISIHALRVEGDGAL